jgi:acyl carrier protein
MDARALIAEITRSDLAAQDDNTLLADVENWDSLRAVRLVLRLEEITGRPLGEADIDHLKTIGDVARLLQAGA